MNPTITDSIIRKINEQEITNSKDIRKLRLILKDPVAKEAFVSAGGTIDSALRGLAPAPTKKPHGLLGDIEQISESLQRHPWTTLITLKGNSELLRKLEDTEKLLKELRKALSK